MSVANDGFIGALGGSGSIGLRGSLPADGTDAPLASWAAVRDTVEAHVELLRQEDTWVGFYLTTYDAWVKVVLGGGDEPTISVLAPACDVDLLKISDPTRLQGTALVVPTLVVEASLYVVREVAPLSTLTVSALDRMITFVAASAAGIRREIERLHGTLVLAANFSE